MGWVYNGKPYFLMDDLGGKTPIFGNIHIVYEVLSPDAWISFCEFLRSRNLGRWNSIKIIFRPSQPSQEISNPFHLWVNPLSFVGRSSFTDSCKDWLMNPAWGVYIYIYTPKRIFSRHWGGTATTKNPAILDGFTRKKVSNEKNPACLV